MDTSKIAKFVNSYLFFCTAGEDPGGADGNLLTNYVDDGATDIDYDLLESIGVDSDGIVPKGVYTIRLFGPDPKGGERERTFEASIRQDMNVYEAIQEFERQLFSWGIHNLGYSPGFDEDFIEIYWVALNDNDIPVCGNSFKITSGGFRYKDSQDENDVSLYSDEELHERFKKLLEQFEKKNPKRDLKGITLESDEIPELTEDMGREFFGVDLGSASK